MMMMIAGILGDAVDRPHSSYCTNPPVRTAGNFRVD